MSWEPISRETTDATADHLAEILGLSRATFRASSFLSQGDAGAFTEARPADRKALLAEVIDPRQVWPRLAVAARDQARQVDATIVGDRATADHLAGVAAELPQLREAKVTLERQEQMARAELTEAERTLEAAQQAVAATAVAVERHRAAGEAVQTATAARDRAQADLAEAKSQADRLAPAREQLETLTAVAARIPKLEAGEKEQRERQAAIEAAQRAKADARAASERQKSRVLDLRAAYASTKQQLDQATARLNHLAEAPDGTERCEACEQLLGKEAKEAAMRSLQQQIETLTETLNEQQTAGADAATELARLEAEHDVIETPTLGTLVDYPTLLKEARAAAENANGIAARIEQFAAHHDRLPALTENLRTAAGLLKQRQAELQQAAAEMGDQQTLHQAVLDARQKVNGSQSRLEELVRQHAGLSGRILTADQAAADLTEIRSRTEAAQQRLDLLRLAERAYGRDGIPVLLVEQVIPQLEAEANRILEQMPTSDGVVLNVELRTLRALKTDAEKTRETLDILVADPDGQRAYETFSGGERARLNIALRIALAKLLAGRRGAESRLLAIDELEYLDSLGQGQLVDVVRGVASSFDTVLIVSHADVLRDAFDHVIEIEKRDGVSAIAGAREPEAVAA